MYSCIVASKSRGRNWIGVLYLVCYYNFEMYLHISVILCFMTAVFFTTAIIVIIVLTRLSLAQTAVWYQRKCRIGCSDYRTHGNTCDRQGLSRARWKVPCCSSDGHHTISCLLHPKLPRRWTHPLHFPSRRGWANLPGASSHLVREMRSWHPSGCGCCLPLLSLIYLPMSPFCLI